jgi:flagellin-like hook-associated protein FlgL
MAVYPVPTTRSSNLLVQERLLSQMQSDQIQLLRLQSQVSTGRRVLVPSDDAPAAVRGMTLQRLLELKTQTKVNITTTQSYVAAADTSLGNVSDLLNDVRALMLSAADSATGPEGREAALQGVSRAIDQLVTLGNTQFRDRYLFSGSRTNVQPFTTSDKYVIYNGNEGSLRSYATLESLFDANVSGDAAFGAFSQPAGNSLDLNPVVTENTLLTDLRGGLGITLGSIAISDGNTTRTIDISGARTVGDVAALLQANPPAGRSITARVTNTGLSIDLDDAGGGNLSIREVGNGTTAAELGILNEAGTGIAPIVGGDLNPRLKRTTPISELGGSRAIAYLGAAGSNNDLVLRAKTNGAALNGFAVQFVDDDLLQAAPGLAAGSETVTYNSAATASRAALSFSGFNNNLVLTATTPGTNFNNVKIQVASAGAIGNAANVSYDASTKTLTVGVDSTGATEIQTVINAIGAEGTFSAAYDPSDAIDGGYVPTALVQASDIGIVSGNTGNSGGGPNTIFVNIDPGATNASQVLTALQASAAVTASFDIQLDDDDTASPANAGLGVMDVNASAVTGGGSGADIDLSGGLRIVQGPKTYDVPLGGVQTVEDLLNAINGSGAVVQAEIDASGSGVQIRSRLAGADFSIGENGGQIATQLGVRTFAAGTQLASLNHGRGVQTTTGADLTITRSDGTQLAIDLDGANTVQEVLDRINTNAANTDPANRVNAQLSAVGNGIELVESPAAGPGVLTVQTTFGSNAAVDLGLVPVGQTQSQAPGGASQTLTGRDVNPQEVNSVFDTLIRLKDAIANFDLPELDRLDGKLNTDLNRALYARSDLGARGQALDAIGFRLEDEQLQLKDSLSKDIEVDMTEVISSMYAKQSSLQASLQLMSRTFELTLLNYL